MQYLQRLPLIVLSVSFVLGIGLASLSGVPVWVWVGGEHRAGGKAVAGLSGGGDCGPLRAIIPLDEVVFQIGYVYGL
jgi:hypothetical protein